jgi:sec-independent protein translocase protein TatA
MVLDTLLFGMPGGWEWALIALVVILLFGAKKIPELARGMGKGIREFKDATKEINKEITDVKEEVAEDTKKATKE